MLSDGVQHMGRVHQTNGRQQRDGALTAQGGVHLQNVGTSNVTSLACNTTEPGCTIHSSCMALVNVASAWWEMTAALGLPVVPEVKMA